MRTPRGPRVAVTATLSVPCSNELAIRLSRARSSWRASASTRAAPRSQRTESERPRAAAGPRHRSAAPWTSAAAATGRGEGAAGSRLTWRSRASSAASAASTLPRVTTAVRAADAAAPSRLEATRLSACSGRRSSWRARFSAVRRRDSRTRSPATATARLTPTGQPALISDESSAINASPLDEAVPDAPDVDHVAPVLGIELSPQSARVGVERARVPERPEAPDAAQQLPLGETPPRLGRERAQKRVLLAGELDLP